MKIYAVLTMVLCAAAVVRTAEASSQYLRAGQYEDETEIQLTSRQLKKTRTKKTRTTTIKGESTSKSKSTKSTKSMAASLKQGNFPALNGQSTNMRPQGGGATPSDVMCGAVQAVLTLPSNANVCFAGGANGGVWRTRGCTNPQPFWEPLTDTQESLSVGDMEFDSDDPTGNTILVGVGTRSALGRLGGPAIGLLYTKNARAPQPTWKVLDNQNGDINFRDKKVKFRSTFVRGNLMMAAAYTDIPTGSINPTIVCDNNGVFRSTDRGKTWTNVLKGNGLEVAADPNDPNRFYAVIDFAKECRSDATQNNGVFTSNDSGETWTFTSLVPGTTQIAEGELNNAKLSVSRSTSRVWSALLRNGVADSISYSDDQGTSWVRMDDVDTTEVNDDPRCCGLNPREKPGGWGGIHFSLLASPTNPNEIYVGGDRQPDAGSPNFWPNDIGATDYTGRLFRGDASVTPTGAPLSPQWEHMTDVQNEGFPGGGTASSSGPHADSRDMAIRADGRLLEGNDGGIVVRTFPADNTGDWFGVCGNMQVFETHNIAYDPIWRRVLFGNQDVANILGTLGQAGSFETISKGDGNICMIDYTSHPNLSYYYHGSQNLRSFTRRTIHKSTGTPTGPNVDIKANLPSGFAGSFVTVGAMNRADQKVFALALGSTSTGDQIALTINRGTTFTRYPSALAGTTITAMVWSGDGTVLYVASGVDTAACTLSTTGLSCSLVSSGPSGTGEFRRLAVNPDNRGEVYAAKTARDLSSPQVFGSLDGGITWMDITAGSPVAKAAIGGAVAYIKKGTTSAVVVGTSDGVHVLDRSKMTWKLLATDLPKVPVMEMIYEEMDDRLILATLGRGVWYLDRASDLVSSVLTGDMDVTMDMAMDVTMEEVTMENVTMDLTMDVTEDVASTDDLFEVQPDDAPSSSDSSVQIIV